jgi:hypothetical protein
MPLGNMDPGLVGLSTFCFAVVPHNSNDHPAECRYLYVGTGGNVALVNLDGSVVVHTAVPAGSYILCSNRRVNATGTTASNIVGYR